MPFRTPELPPGIPVWTLRVAAALSLLPDGKDSAWRHALTTLA